MTRCSLCDKPIEAPVRVRGVIRARKYRVTHLECLRLVWAVEKEVLSGRS